jgi:ParB family chromosome partitioning protein
MELNRWTGKEVADALSLSASKVSRALALLDLPEDVQERVTSGAIPRTTAYELSKLNNEETRRHVAEQAASGTLTHRETTKRVRQRRGKRPVKTRGIRLAFKAESGIKVAVTAGRKITYHDIEQALLEALDDVRARIENNVQLY